MGKIEQIKINSKLLCPRCRAKTAWEGNPYRPFCSARCRSIDLGAWADEEYRVPGGAADNQAQADNLDSSEND
jgi:hypothetical protein